MCLYLWAGCFANKIWLLKMFNLMLKSQHVLIPKWLNGVIYNDSQNRIWPFEEYQQQSSWARIVIWLRLWNSCEKDRSGWILLNKAACQNLLCSSCRTAVWPPVSQFPFSLICFCSAAGEILSHVCGFICLLCVIKYSYMVHINISFFVSPAFRNPLAALTPLNQWHQNKGIINICVCETCWGDVKRILDAH